MPCKTTKINGGNRVPVAVQYSRQLLAQTSLSVEAMLRNDMAYQLAALIDAAGINKILSNASVTAINSGGANGLAASLLTIVGMETAVAIQNAADGQLGYLVNPSLVIYRLVDETSAATE